MTKQIEWQNIKGEIIFEGYRKDDKWPHFAWRLRLQGIDRVFDYETGIGHAVKRKDGHWGPTKRESGKSYTSHPDFNGIIEVPTLERILACLVLDADEIFDDWCSNFGYDPDSRKALETYLKCQSVAKDLRKLKLTDEQKEELREL